MADLASVLNLAQRDPNVIGNAGPFDISNLNGQAGYGFPGSELFRDNPPSNAIERQLAAASLRYYQFPDDITRYNFTIIESTPQGAGLAAAAGTGVTYLGGAPVAMYVLPFPTVIQDTHDVKYDHNFDWLQMAMSAFGRAGGAVGGVVDAAGRLLGFAPNNFRALTLTAPNFRTFSLEFRLFPKSIQESGMIQRMIVALKTGMHPPVGAAVGTTNLIFSFPNVFYMYFNPGGEFLYRFKPCVIDAMQVNYQGDAPSPAFYRNNLDTAIPEGVVIRMNCIELEVWTRDDFIAATNNNTGQAGFGLFTRGPFDAISGARNRG